MAAIGDRITYCEQVYECVSEFTNERFWKGRKLSTTVHVWRSECAVPGCGNPVVFTKPLKFPNGQRLKFDRRCRIHAKPGFRMAVTALQRRANEERSKREAAGEFSQKQLNKQHREMRDALLDRVDDLIRDVLTIWGKPGGLSVGEVFEYAKQTCTADLDLDLPTQPAGMYRFLHNRSARVAKRGRPYRFIKTLRGTWSLAPAPVE